MNERKAGKVDIAKYVGPKQTNTARYKQVRTRCV